MTFRVLFLDIDGVLNSEAYLLANPGAFEREGPHAYYKMFDPEACARLQTICEVTDAQIVISSSMRKIHPITDLRLFLEARGVTAPVIDVTPGYAGDPYEWSACGLSMTCRGHEILAWVDAHPELDSYAVVDDDSDMDGVRHRFVRTSWAEGLRDQHMLPLIRTLMRPRNFFVGETVYVYGVQIVLTAPVDPSGSWHHVPVHATLDQYAAGTVVAVEPSMVRVKLLHHDSEVEVPPERLSLPFTWAQSKTA